VKSLKKNKRSGDTCISQNLPYRLLSEKEECDFLTERPSYGYVEGDENVSNPSENVLFYSEEEACELEGSEI